ncbi:MAG: winged helix-turn-helix transcriptional regulator [Candidatus Lokiarchaeota archaeon]|nr:winged helix-turn-helix transcriptional regulator [Candidatus Lokiarchaeota archaeon]
MLITEFHNFYKKEGLNQDVIRTFQNIIYSYFKQYGREFPFRREINPYNVVISEMMLQQTQTNRVSEKFEQFIQEFPDFQSLANAPLNNVLKVWQGLGYNRRAVALKNIAEKVVNEFDGILPADVEILKSFPQIGHNTASSIVAFAFNMPTFFIEVNIRRVYIYYFFPGKNSVNDSLILPIVRKTLDRANVRKWYYALMDYGVMLKKTHPELNKRSAHYRKQSKFKGSDREIRGKILRLLIANSNLTESDILKELNINSKKLNDILNLLIKEGFIKKEKHLFSIP